MHMVSISSSVVKVHGAATDELPKNFIPTLRISVPVSGTDIPTLGISVPALGTENYVCHKQLFRLPDRTFLPVWNNFSARLASVNLSRGRIPAFEDEADLLQLRVALVALHLLVRHITLQLFGCSCFQASISTSVVSRRAYFTSLCSCKQCPADGSDWDHVKVGIVFRDLVFRQDDVAAR